MEKILPSGDDKRFVYHMKTSSKKDPEIKQRRINQLVQL